MKPKSLAQILIVLGFALGSCMQEGPASLPGPEPPTSERSTPTPERSAPTPEPSAQTAKRWKFFCGTHEDLPATMAATSRGNIVVILWDSYLSGVNEISQIHCIEVARRFQNYYNNNQLLYIMTSEINGYPVVCVAEARADGCAGILLVLKPGTDPMRILQKLLNILEGQAKNPLREIEDGIADPSVLSSEIAKNVYININKYLSMSQYLRTFGVYE